MGVTPSSAVLSLPGLHPDLPVNTLRIVDCNAIDGMHLLGVFIVSGQGTEKEFAHPPFLHPLLPFNLREGGKCAPRSSFSTIQNN